MDEILTALTEELQASESELLAIDRQMEPLRLRHEEIEAVVKALKFTIERRTARQAEPPADPEWVGLSLRAAVERTLSQLGALTVQELRAALRERGRPNDARKSISATLSHLKTEGKVSSADGRWQLHGNGQVLSNPAFDTLHARPSSSLAPGG